MASTLRHIRPAVLWAMMPLALWAGLQLPECECASGERRILCPYAMGLPQRVAQKAQCSTARPSCCKQKSTDCCSQQDDSNSPCSSCKLIVPETLAGTDSVDAQTPSGASLLFVDVSPLVQVALTTSGRDQTLQSHDVGPPDDLLIVHCRLLI